MKAELGYHLIGVDGEPYISWTSVFSQIIQPYLDSGTSTTSSTSVSAATSPTPVNLTLASATGFASGARVVIDVDERQEMATIQHLNGSVITVQLRNAHSGTYPVSIEGSGEAIVREILRKIRDVKAEMATARGEGAVKAVDEIEFFDSGMSLFGALGNQLAFWREELAAALGVQSMWAVKRRGAQTLSVY